MFAVRRCAMLLPLACAMLFPGSSLRAQQCADGTTSCRAAERPVPIDPRRIAIIPFRVTTTDSLFGEGFAELLAPEFTGQGSARAVDMSSTLNAWRRAGGGHRNPLALDAAMRLARGLGAGLLCQGSVVGVGGRLNITASIVDATSGATIGTTTRVSGSIDSVDVLLEKVATGLLGANASARVREASSLTKSPEALRSYLEGLTFWRQGKWNEAAAAFETSSDADTMFASAAYQRWLLGTSTAGGIPARFSNRTRTLRDGLTPREKTVVDAVVGTGAPRTPEQVLAARVGAAQKLVDAPEAWFFAGDYVYHSGLGLVGPDSVLPKAREYFSRAARDSQPVYLFHLHEIALHQRDTTLMRTLLRTYERLEGEERWSRSLVLAAALGDATLVARIKRSPAANPTVISVLALMTGAQAPIPVAVVDDAIGQLKNDREPTLPPAVAAFRWALHAARGRPSAATIALGNARAALWNVQLVPFIHISGDSGSDAALVQAHGNERLANAAAEGRRQCVIARLEIERARPPVSVDLSAQRLPNARCRGALAAWRDFKNGSLTDSSLRALDNAVTNGTSFTSFLGFEHRLLARIYESRGDTARAVRAIQYYPRDYHGVWFAPTMREAGRYFLMARDTVRARESYERYLELRAEAEPSMIPERDSIKTILAPLQPKR